MNQPLLHIIVLNNNRCEETLACLASLFQSDYKNLHIILVDNGSPESFLQAVHEDYPPVQCISLTENLGYAGNNNLGIRSAMEQGAEWILVLNDDTIVDPSCLSLLVEAGESDPSIGMVGPMVYHFDEPQVIQSAGGTLGKYWEANHLGANELDGGQFKSVREVEWISGCAILVRSAVVEQIGMLDEDYFLYWEETEWCIRAAKAGWKIVLVPNAKLWHKGVNRNYEPRPHVTYYMTRNYLYTLAKHKAPFLVRTLVFVNVLRTLLSWSVMPRWRNKHDHRNAKWKGMIDFVYGRMGPMAF